MNEIKNIKYSIISRGEMVLYVDDKVLKVSGELTFTPSVFYADIVSMKKWEPPYDEIFLTEEEKMDIVKRVTEETKDKELKIVFD